MVKETRIVFEVKDIRAFKVRCKKCLNEISLRLDNERGIPDDCPMCNAPKWAVGTSGYGLLKALRGAYDEESNNGSIIRLEIDGEQM